MTKIKIGMVLDSPFTSDLRVEKEASSLISEGFEVHLLCGIIGDQPTEELRDGIHIHRANILMDVRHKGIRDILSSLDFINRPFRKALDQFIQDVEPQVLHVHDLPLSKTVRLAAKKNNIPFILDLHENYPEGLKTWFKWRKSIAIRTKNAVFFNYSKWLKYEERECKKTDHIIAVVDEMKTRLNELHKVELSKIVVVSNTERKSFKEHFSATDKNPLPTGFNITYIGGIGPHRGLDTAIAGMPEVLRLIPEAKLNLVGSGNKDVTSKLVEQIEQLGLKERVILHGQKPFKLVNSYMSHSQVNIIPHHSNDHTNNTIPHKLFQILMSEAPLLVSSCKPLERIVKQHEAGSIFQAGDPKSFAESIFKIHSHPKIAQERCANGTRAVVEHFHWDLDGQQLINLYREVLAKRTVLTDS